MSKLIRWETPFTDCEFPIALPLTSFSLDAGFNLKVLVAPRRIDAYPKYLVEFGDAIAFTCFEEAHQPEIHTSKPKIDGKWSSACEWLASPWLESYSLMWDHGKTEKLRHYLIFGADFNLEIVTRLIPTFETIDEPKLLNLLSNI